MVLAGVAALFHARESCQQIADKYLEYDPVNIIIDLVLLNEQAYRHILYNYNFQNHWKLAVVLLLVEAYSDWSWVPDQLDTHSQLDLFDRERSFYWTCLQTIIGSTMLFLIVCAITKVYRPPHDCHYITLWKALVLASFCKFLLVPGLIWGEMGPVTHHYFVTGYTLLSQLKAHSVVTHSSRLMSGLVVSLGLLGKVASMQLLSQL